MTHCDVALAIASGRMRIKNRRSAVSRRAIKTAIILAIPLFAFVMIPAISHAFDTGQSKSAGGLTGYLGVIPAEAILDYPKDSPERIAHGGAATRRARLPYLRFDL